MPNVPAGPFHRAAEKAREVVGVFAAWVGRGDDPDLPDGWHQFGVDEHGRPLYGYVGPVRSLTSLN